MSKPSIPRAAFSAASFANLRAAAGEGQGDALRIPVAAIDEDPGQPRTRFDEDGLALLADSIREHGVVQPIVVRPPVNGRYRLAFGARRLRAATLAGVADIPAVIRPAGADDFAAQVIENQHRADLSNSDLAAAIARLAEQGHTGKQIATICSLKDYEISAFRQAVNFPPDLRARLDAGDMRALYDLYRQWQKTPDAVIAALPAADTFLTVTEARRIIGAITGKPTGSIVLERPAASAPAPAATHGADVPASDGPPPSPAEAGVLHPARGSGAEDVLHRANASGAVDVLHRAKPDVPEGDWARAADQPAPVVPARAPAAPDGVRTPVFHVVAGDGNVGRLVVDRRAERLGAALVAYADGIAEVDAAALRIVRVE